MRGDELSGQQFGRRRVVFLTRGSDQAAADDYSRGAGVGGGAGVSGGGDPESRRDRDFGVSPHPRQD